METTFEKIIRKSGFKPVECKCNVCKSQCHTPCFGTPEDMVKIIAAGFEKRVVIKILNNVQMVIPAMDKVKQSCTFFTDGLCELHDSGLKPTVGKLAHHSTTAQNFNIKKSPSMLVLKEWENLSKEKFNALLDSNIIK